MNLICFTSPKGSCGASFCTANIAKILSDSGCRCLVADMQGKSSVLGMYMGCSDAFVYNLTDVLSERCSFSDAVVNNVCESDMDFVSVSPLYDLQSEEFAEYLALMKNTSSYDYILADVPFNFLTVLESGDTAVFVTDPQSANVAVLDRFISSSTISCKAYVLINKVVPELISFGGADNIDDICDTLGLPPLGIIPCDCEVSAYLNKGILSADNKELMSTKALCNIAERIKGNRAVPLDFDYKSIYHKNIKNITYRR